MADEADGIEDALTGTVRLAVTAGARLGAEIARARQDTLREQRRVDERQADRLAQRFEAERRVAVAELGQVHRPDWWDRPSADQIGQLYATARAWAPEDAEAARAKQAMRTELRERYGVDLDRTDPRAVASEVEAWRQRLEDQRRQAAQERTTADAEQQEAAALLGQAAQETHDAARADAQASSADNPRETARDNPWLSPDQTQGRGEAEDPKVQEHQAALSAARDRSAADQSAEAAEPLYDSAARRDADAAAMEASGVDREVAQSRMRADTGVATPATKATAGVRRSRAPKARKAVGRTTQAQRAGVER